jgi:hypothetical protein
VPNSQVSLLSCVDDTGGVGKAVDVGGLVVHKFALPEVMRFVKVSMRSSSCATLLVSSQ